MKILQTNIQADWEQTDTSAPDFIKNKPTDIGGGLDPENLATVATTGDYNDLENKPTIPTVPTKVSAFTNDAGYLVEDDLPTKVSELTNDVGYLTSNIYPIPLEKGGTNATNVSTARINLGLSKAVIYENIDTTTNVNSLALLLYPIGSIYMSVNSSSPEILFGGTWEQIKDVFLLSAGDTYAAGNTGGEATHTLTVNEIPSHTHGVTYDKTDGHYSGSSTEIRLNGDYSSTIGYTGGGAAHNNMPPYLTVYMWRRTA